MVPLGRGAYRREYTGSPEVQLLNRWLEESPANPTEGTVVLSRPGTTEILELDPGTYAGAHPIRGVYSLDGLFANSLFVVCGENLYRITEDLTVVPITGTIAGTGHPEVAWQRGLGYQRLWIEDGSTLQYYSDEVGGLHFLDDCPIPDDHLPVSITQVDSYVLVAIKDTQIFYWVNPAETTIDPLNFASKESSPDNIIAMRTFGDQIGVIGDKSFETWYATGNLAAPFAPIDGRVYQRGAIPGTVLVVNDGVFLVGDDGRVYSIGFQSGDSGDIAWGTLRISNNGIEERIRKQIRRQAGLTP